MTISKEALEEARKHLAEMGQKAFKEKTTEEQRNKWREKGGEATRLKFLRKTKK